MKNATITAVAVALILFILVGSVVLHFTGLGRSGKFVQKVMWNVPIQGNPETLKAIDLDGDGQDEVFVQTSSEVAVFSFQGEELFRMSVTNTKSTMGDFDGDGVDEFAIAWPKEGSLALAAYRLDGTRLWENEVADVGPPSRGNSVDFEGDGRREILFGTEDGYVICIDGQTGSMHWYTWFEKGEGPEDYLVQGLDDVVIRGQSYIAVASYYGVVAVLDGEGEVVWVSGDFPERLRRLRAADMDGDGEGEIMLGGLQGAVWLLSARDGAKLWGDGIGSRVNEARFLEVDGDASSLELVVGSKRGAVQAYDIQGNVLWSQTLTDKVLELESLDYNRDGQPELLVGTADGTVYLLKGDTGEVLASFPVSGVSVIDTGDFRKEGAYAAGVRDAVEVFKVQFLFPPWWYTPLLPGFILALVVAAIAVLASRLRQAPKVTYTVQEMSLEALKARKKMLREVLEDVSKAYRSRELDAQTYLAQSRSIRERLASVEAKLMELQPDYKPELFKCPSCSAPLDIGMDRCPYCGHVLL